MTALDSIRFVCVSVLLFEAGFSAGQFPHFFYPSGQTVILTCGCTPPPTCSKVDWFHSTQQQIIWGNGRTPTGDVRYSLDPDCSLVITNVSGQDAGKYFFRPDERTSDMETGLNLNILTVSESLPNRDGDIALRCSLVGRFPCQWDSVRWVNEDASVSISRGYCVSTITVKRPSEQKRTYTCQFVNENQVQTAVDHTLVLITERKDDPTGNSDPGIIHPEYIGAAAGVMVLLVIIAVIVKMRCTKRDKDTDKQTDGFQNQTNPVDEQESNLEYAMISHSSTRTSNEVRKAEAVTYSTVKTQVKTEADDDVYSSVT